jgi:hypothetical protein
VPHRAGGDGAGTAARLSGDSAVCELPAAVESEIMRAVKNPQRGSATEKAADKALCLFHQQQLDRTAAQMSQKIAQSQYSQISRRGRGCPPFLISADDNGSVDVETTL